MQVTPLPPLPVPPGAMPQETMAKSLPQLQAQASAPIIQRAIDPSGKSERGNKSRSNGDRGKGGGGDRGGRGGSRGGSVNIKV